MSPLRIIVVGGGIGGLAAAIGLAKDGHKTTVFERATSSGGVGYAFRLTPNSGRCLKYLGIDIIAGGGCAVDGGMMYDGKGQLQGEMKENQDPIQAREAPSAFVYRPQVHQQLWDAAIASGVQLLTGIKIQAVDVETTTVTLQDGEVVSADLIIGADGARSVVRPQVTDISTNPLKATTGQNCFRHMLPREIVVKDPLLGPLYNQNGNHIFAWSDGLRRVLVYPVDFGQQINVACIHPESLSDGEIINSHEEAAIDYNEKVSAETALSIYKDLDPRALRFLELADPNGFRIWKLSDTDEIGRWSSNYTVLLGDACHPVLPFGFSGASMAIEDALTLATLLPSGVSKGELRGRLGLYEDIRKERVGKVRDTSRLLGKAVLPDKEVREEYFPFLIKHDAVDFAKKALARHQASESST